MKSFNKLFHKNFLIILTPFLIFFGIKRIFFPINILLIIIGIFIIYIGNYNFQRTNNYIYTTNPSSVSNLAYDVVLITNGS